MTALNRRDMLQLSATCGVGAAISEAAFSRQAIAIGSASGPAVQNESPINPPNISN